MLDGFQVRFRGPGWGKPGTQKPRVEWHESKLGVFYRHEQAVSEPRGQLLEKVMIGWPIASGPVESPCRTRQCRRKRPGQFWSRTGDEALLCLKTFWRNDRWALLFLHTAFNPARN